MAKYKRFVGLGIAGNFALHLNQAGEAKEFAHIITADEAAPKGMFPFFLPRQDVYVEQEKLEANKLLSTYPLGADNIKLPQDTSLKVQAEPEVALICDLEYVAGKLSSITPKYFGAYNDCSIRVDGAKKISEKKNWGHESKGLSNQLIEIDNFSEGGVMDSYAICSFLKRDDKIYAYGEDVELTGYSYFHEKLTDWMLNQINTQTDSDPLEPLSEYLSACHNPKEAIISIGATRYTPFGEKIFLKSGDICTVVVYNKDEYSPETILDAVKNSKYPTTNISVLSQKVL
ncbi:MAG: hypothetical protein GXO30_00500 [Epsilonproteobacteria bacterium]|nr:hypothetical protein [Campylobacterota bacterium]